MATDPGHSQLLAVRGPDMLDQISLSRCRILLQNLKRLLCSMLKKIDQVLIRGTVQPECIL